MTKSKAKISRKSDSQAKTPGADGTLPFGHMLTAQEVMLEAAQEFAARWLARRQEAGKALATLSAAKSPLEAVSLWEAGAWERLTEDIHDWSIFCARCTNAVMQEEAVAAVTVANASKPARQQLYERHATPV
jgi:hypothetical protein